MKFGELPLNEAEGALLAHSLREGGLRLRKAHRLTAADLLVLRRAGVHSVTAAALDEGDVDEDTAAGRLAAAMRIPGAEHRPPGTGRANFHASSAGVFTVDKEAIDGLNRLDPALTVATLADFTHVEQGQMVATIKIIPFAVPEGLLTRGEDLLRRRDAGRLYPYRARQVGLVQTVLPTVKDSILDKTRRITQQRLDRSSSTIVTEARVPHAEPTLAEAIGQMLGQVDLVLVFGASALCDAEDVIPAALRSLGGHVERVGMPVDPGNLLVLGRVGDTQVIGAPGCARSSKENGLDWILDRVMAGIEVTGADIAGMGVGGLLGEIATRPQPRERAEPHRRPIVHAAVLAAGRSSRMGGPNKLLALFDGKPLISRVVGEVTASRVAATLLVTGHQAQAIRDATADTAAIVVDNAEFADGLSTSLKAAVRALPDAADGLLVVLGDMPAVTRSDLDLMISQFEASGGRAIVRATHAGKRGNPVLLPKSVFGEIATIEGDMGARSIVEGADIDIVDVELGEAASLDVDTPDALQAAGGRLQETE